MSDGCWTFPVLPMIATPPYYSGQFQAELEGEFLVANGKRRNPLYCSGQFQGPLLIPSSWVPWPSRVASPPYCSGKFQVDFEAACRGIPGTTSQSHLLLRAIPSILSPEGTFRAIPTGIPTTSSPSTQKRRNPTDCSGRFQVPRSALRHPGGCADSRNPTVLLSGIPARQGS